MKQLEDAFNTNTKAFSDGIQMLEAQQEAVRRALEDLRRGAPMLTEVNPGGFIQRIDWNHYLKEYIQEMADAEAKAEEKAGPGSVLASVDEDAPIIFGGDTP